MPRKRDMDKSYGEKVIRLLGSLMFAKHPQSLSELSEMLNCSKQTIERIIRDIESACQVKIEYLNMAWEALYVINNREPLL